MRETVAERVAKGAALLDQKEPAWDERIDLGDLRMWNGCKCILGQVYGSYNGAIHDLLHLEWDDAIAHGFNAAAGYDSYSYYGAVHDEAAWSAELTELDAEWRRVIAERRAAVAP